MANLLLAFEGYLLLVFAVKAVVHYQNAYRVLRMITRSPKWPHLLRLATRHRALLVTLPNLAWTLTFLSVLGLYAALLHVAYPEASVTVGDLNGTPWLFALVGVLGVLMAVQDAADLVHTSSVRSPDDLRRLDRAERALRWTGPVGRLVAGPHIRRKLLRAGLALNEWLKHAFALFVTRLAFGFLLWLPWFLR